MANSLYALQTDLDMITEKIQFLYTGFNTLDWMAQHVKRLDEEMTCQGEQMRRIEGRMDKIEERMAKMEANMNRMEGRMDKMEKLLLLICKKLEIKV